MKVLFINNARGRGGGEEYLRDLLPGLAGKGIGVGLVCRPGTPLETMFRGTDVEVHPVDRSGIRGAASILRIAAIVRRGDYRVVNIQRGHDIVQSWLAARCSGTRPKTLYTVQVTEFLRSRFLLRRMDALVTISRHLRERLAAFDPSIAGRTSIIHYGIDLGRFRPAAVPTGFLRERFRLGADTRIIGTVGDLWKNQIEFLDVLSLLRARCGDVRYAIVGQETGSDLVKAFRFRAAALGLTDAVLWPGRLAREQMLGFYADIDLAVSTYR